MSQQNHTKTLTKNLSSKTNTSEHELNSVSFMYEPPPGLISEPKPRPEDEIPDLPENQEAREFLKKAPQQGLWMPLGKEVKVMQCWRCKAYGHRTGDRECPLFQVGNLEQEKLRKQREDPMSAYTREQSEIREKEKMEKLARVNALKALLEDVKKRKRQEGSSSSESESNSHKSKKKKKKKKKKSKK